MLEIVNLANEISIKIKNTTGLKTYSNESIEAIHPASFFLNIIESASQFTCRGIFKRYITATVLYFPPEGKLGTRVRDEKDCLNTQKKLMEIFYNPLKVEDRHITFRSAKTDYVGEFQDILKMEFVTEFFDDIENEEEVKQNISSVEIMI